jgi:hypothetical protein
MQSMADRDLAVVVRWRLTLQGTVQGVGFRPFDGGIAVGQVAAALRGNSLEPVRLGQLEGTIS